MKHTDTQLKQALAKMLPEYVKCRSCANANKGDLSPIEDTELLHLCWLVEETLPIGKAYQYYLTFQDVGICGNNHWKEYHASWQQRTIALAKVKNIDI